MTVQIRNWRVAIVIVIVTAICSVAVIGGVVLFREGTRGRGSASCVGIGAL